jgi:dolichol-phosphate mannosyltransferase
MNMDLSAQRVGPRAADRPQPSGCVQPDGTNALASAGFVACAPELSIVVPTFNEAENVRILIERVAKALEGVNWEIIIVDDDSPDGTADAVRSLARTESRVRCLQRIGRRGLSSACVEGMLASSAPYLAVMDADLQHDERILPTMLELLRSDRADIAIGSRYVEGGSAGDFPDDRARISQIATRLALATTQVPVADPMSGYFMLTSTLLHATVRSLSATGFKILLDILASAPHGYRALEVPYRFGERYAGTSKLDTKAAWDYLVLLLDKSIGRYVPTRFVIFSLVGTLGVAVHMAVLGALFKTGTSSFFWGQLWAALVAMTFNFALNNVVTYRDRKLRGIAWLAGWATFVLACSLGAAANVGIAEYLFEHDRFWAVSALAGIVIGAVWNYAVTSVYTWKSA